MKKILGITLAAIGAVIVLIIAIGVLAGGSKKPAANGHTQPAAPVTATQPAPVTQTPQPVAVTETPQGHTVTRVLFKVTGTAADGADITYGSDSDNLSPHGGLGVLGSGTALPWQGSIRWDKSALYYDVSAQLQGSGDIRCFVLIKVTMYYGDGTHLSRSKVLAHGHASGSYNICDAQVNN